MENNYEELCEKYKSLLADFENYKKRVADISDTEYRKGYTDAVLNIIPVLDNMERGLRYESNYKSLAEGMNNIRHFFEKRLESMGFEVMDVLGTDFDGDVCECVHQVDVPKEYRGKVFEIVLNGYVKDGKIVRYPKVVVGK